MKEDARSALNERYNERLRKYGHDPRSLGWLKGGQRIRFGALTAIGKLERASILDVGCGFGDLYSYLTEKGLKIRYKGIDINPNFIEIAERIHPEARFETIDMDQVNPCDRYDYIIASGLFEFDVGGSEYVHGTLRKMHGICRKGIAADFLSSYVDYRSENSYHANPEEIFTFAKTLSKRVLLRHDYMPFEFCIYIYRNDKHGKDNVFEEETNESIPKGG